jgi:putative oxidoreductase
MNTESWSPKVLSLLRFITGLLFLQHGIQKVLHPAFLTAPPPPGAAAAGHAAAAGAPHAPSMMMTLAGASGWFELVGGILIILGLFTRPVAFILSGEMAIAYFLAHNPRSMFPILNGGDLAVLLCFVFFYFAFAGGGSISVDQLMKKRV